jgi:hypothetical protein
MTAERPTSCYAFFREDPLVDDLKRGTTFAFTQEQAALIMDEKRTVPLFTSPGVRTTDGSHTT